MAKRGFEEATRALSGYIVAGRAGQGTATLDGVGKVCSILGIDLGRLSAIHVAGTKGKGSTSGTTNCALILLRVFWRCYVPRAMVRGVV